MADECFNSTAVFEMSCLHNDSLLGTPTQCPTGTMCLNGACAAPQCGGNDVACQTDANCCTGFLCLIGTAQQGKRCKEVPANCTETDGGKVPNVFGITTGANCIGCNVEVDSDSCYDANTVREQFCASPPAFPNIKMAYSEDMPCQYGCSNGVCNAAPSAPACNDSDGGVVYDVFGTTTGKMTSGGSAQTYHDACKLDQYGYQSYTLQEYYCNAGTNLVVMEEYVCPNGCHDGVCYPPPSCTETDGGRIYTTKGILTYTTQGFSSNHTDYCTLGDGATRLTEYYCLPNNGGMAVEDITCPSGGKCTVGKCG